MKGDISDEVAEPEPSDPDAIYQHITNRSSFNLQRYFADEAGFGTIRSSMLGAHNDQEYGHANPDEKNQSKLSMQLR